MATIHVIHAAADRDFVESTLLKPLPSLGFDRWTSSAASSPEEASGGGPAAIASSAATIVVVSEASRASGFVQAEAALALRAPQPTIPVQLDQTEPETVAPGLGAMAKIDLRDVPGVAATSLTRRLRAGLAALLPPIPLSADREVPETGRLIAWNEESFSDYLQEAMTHHDCNGAAALMASLARHLRERTDAYPSAHARNDLKTLRRKRQFRLMTIYAEVVIASGNEDLQVRRQLAQALIDLGKFDDALPVLEGIVTTAAPDDGERVEALGLIGRLFKQRYVNEPDHPLAADWLRRSFDKYHGVYRSGPDNFWHGVNAASLLLRAHRDGITWAHPDEARAIAAAIVERFDALARDGRLYVWDFASRVEALLALDRFDEAAAALDAYLTHPDLDAFEVSSTFRQFDQVLQLGKSAAGRAVYERLQSAADRYRAGGATSSLPQRDAVQNPELLPILIRVSDPIWNAADDVPGLRIGARLGTVLSARATAPAIHALLKDPVVIAIEESRSVADVQTNECARGLPFIRVAASYGDSIGPFAEKGRQALIAFIDDGIDVLHQAFTDGQGKTRVVGIWDQRDETGPPPPGFSYGTHHTQACIQQYLDSSTVPAGLGRNVKGHGTHVASIAAGRAAGDFFGGVAPEAGILVVIARLDGEIGYSDAHLEALSFIDTLATERGLPVVVNVSKGMNAGAHDGTSAFEIGFDEFSRGGRKPGRVVVKSAGNEQDKRGHAETYLTAGAGQLLRWTRKPQTWKFERIELWWSSSDALTFRLGSPGGDWSAPVSDAAPDVSGTLRAGGKFQMQLIKRHVDNGDSQLRIEMGDALRGVAPGIWLLEIVAGATHSGKPLHAWIGRGGGAPSEFEYSDRKITLTVPGTAHSVISVGAIDAREPPFLGDFSSLGPTRDGRDKPDVSAPGVCVMAAAAGTSTGSRAESGTSMAAPHVAGAIALLLSRAAASGRHWPVANQVRSALTQKTRNFNGRFDPGQGYGVVDVAALLASF